MARAGFASNISAGEAGQTVSFTVTNNNNALFNVPPAISTNGTLTFTPTAGQVGVAKVTVMAKDNGGTAGGGVDTSAEKTFLITVVANAAPAVTFAEQTVAVAQTAGAQFLLAFATFSPGPSYEAHQTLVNYTVTASPTNLFSTQPAIGTTGNLISVCLGFCEWSGILNYNVSSSSTLFF